MKETKASIAIKIGAIFSFLTLIIGGVMLLFYGLGIKDLKFSLLGGLVLITGIYVTAILSQYIAKHDGQEEFKNLTFKRSLKGAWLFTFFASFFIFFGISLYIWNEWGLWYIGLIGILSFIFMIFLSIEISIRYQTGAVKTVLSDREATEHIGTIATIDPHFRIQYFGRTKVFFYSLNIKIGSTVSTTFLRNNNKLAKQLQVSDKVKVLFNPGNPQYCAIIVAPQQKD